MLFCGLLRYTNIEKPLSGVPHTHNAHALTHFSAAPDLNNPRQINNRKRRARVRVRRISTVITTTTQLRRDDREDAVR